MIILWFSLAVVLGILLGGLIGFKLRHSKYDGIITMKEQDGKMIFTLMVSDDPELLANQKQARFKIIPPTFDYSQK